MNRSRRTARRLAFRIAESGARKSIGNAFPPSQLGRGMAHCKSHGREFVHSTEYGVVHLVGEKDGLTAVSAPPSIQHGTRSGVIWPCRPMRASPVRERWSCIGTTAPLRLVCEGPVKGLAARVPSQDSGPSRKSGESAPPSLGSTTSFSRFVGSTKPRYPPRPWSSLCFPGV